MNARGVGPAAVGLAGLLLWAAVFWSGPLVNDVGWQLWIGREMNRGASLYGDIFEVWYDGANVIAETISGDTSPRMILRIRSSISS